MIVDFLNTNANRRYPFLDDARLSGLPDSAIVDAGFVAGVRSRFDAVSDDVWLQAVERRGDLFYFTFACNAPGLLAVPLVFVRHLADPAWTRQFLDSGETEGQSLASESASNSSSISPPEQGTCYDPLWSGYLVTGSMSDLAAVLPGDGALTGTALVLPTLVQNLADCWVVSLNLANADRTRATACDGCPEIVYPFPTGLVYVQAACLQGELTISAGYNSVVEQNAATGALTITASAGRGLGQPCGEVPLFDGEKPPPGTPLLSGNPTCNQLLRSINGVGGPEFSLTGGSGVTVTALPGSYTVKIDINGAGITLCTTDGLSEVSLSDDDL